MSIVHILLAVVIVIIILFIFLYTRLRQFGEHQCACSESPIPFENLDNIIDYFKFISY